MVLGNNARKLRALVGSSSEGAVPVANDGLRDKGGIVVGRVPRDTFGGNGDVSSGDGIVTETDF